jgi:hypothetical protein
MSDLLTYASVFDDVYLYPPLLEACSHVIGEPFKLSSFLARTVRGGTPAQELHADLARGSEDARTEEKYIEEMCMFNRPPEAQLGWTRVHLIR